MHAADGRPAAAYRGLWKSRHSLPKPSVSAPRSNSAPPAAWVLNNTVFALVHFARTDVTAARKTRCADRHPRPPIRDACACSMNRRSGIRYSAGHAACQTLRVRGLIGIQFVELRRGNRTAEMTGDAGIVKTLRLHGTVRGDAYSRRQLSTQHVGGQQFATARIEEFCKAQRAGESVDGGMHLAAGVGIVVVEAMREDTVRSPRRAARAYPAGRLTNYCRRPQAAAVPPVRSSRNPSVSPRWRHRPRRVCESARTLAQRFRQVFVAQRCREFAAIAREIGTVLIIRSARWSFSRFWSNARNRPPENRGEFRGVSRRPPDRSSAGVREDFGELQDLS